MDLGSGQDCYGARCLATWGAAVVEVGLEAVSAAVEAAVDLVALAAGARVAAGRSAAIRKRESRWYWKN